MFGKKDFLPVHGGSRRNNGISNMPIINQSVLVSVVWLMVSILLIIFGISNCRSNAYSYKLDCDQQNCLFTRNLADKTVIEFPKSDLLDAEYTRIGPLGNIVDSAKMKDEPNVSYGHSIKLNARLPVEEGSNIKVEKQIVFSKHDMGRRTARSSASRITRYINSRTDSNNSSSKKSGRSKRNRNDETINIYSGRSVTLLGMSCIALGFMSSIFACLLGQFSEESKRNRLKKAS